MTIQSLHGVSFDQSIFCCCSSTPALGSDTVQLTVLSLKCGVFESSSLYSGHGSVHAGWLLFLCRDKSRHERKKRFTSRQPQVLVHQQLQNMVRAPLFPNTVITFPQLTRRPLRHSLIFHSGLWYISRVSLIVSLAFCLQPSVQPLRLRHPAHTDALLRRKHPGADGEGNDIVSYWTKAFFPSLIQSQHQDKRVALFLSASFLSFIPRLVMTFKSCF